MRFTTHTPPTVPSSLLPIEGVNPMVLHLAESVSDVSGRDVLSMVFDQFVLQANLSDMCVERALKDLDVDTKDKFCARTMLVQHAIEGDAQSGAIISTNDLVVFEEGLAMVTTCLLAEVHTFRCACHDPCLL